MAKTGFALAVERLGTQKAVSDILGCTQQKVSWSLLRNFPMTAEQALKLEEATRGTDNPVTKAELRPDIFGEPVGA